MNRMALEKIQKEGLDLAEGKNKDYSTGIDNIGITGRVGLVVRMFDKCARLLSLIVFNQKQNVKDEDVRQTALDLVNYSTYLVSVIDGTWSGKEEVDK